VCALGFTLALSAAACGGGGSEAPASSAPASSAPSASAGTRVDAATAATISGVVSLSAAAPANEAIRMNADPVCLKQAPGTQTQETFVVGPDGKTLGNVFVYVKDGLGNYVFDAPAGPVTLDQKGCRYHPHVFGVRVNQPLEIINSDPTLHNVHATPKNNKEFNTGQPMQGMKSTYTFTAAEVMVPFKCDVHGWMNAYVGVLPHPLFATTGPDGRFEIKGVPPGTYTIEAWHERLGPMTQSVTVAASESKDVPFTFTPGAPAATD
jgi:hypothetical protein